MSKVKRNVLIIFTSIFVLLGAFVLFWYFGDSYPQFYKYCQKEFAIHGLSEGFTPQGICFNEATESFLYCGYMKNGSASRVYVYNKNSKQTKYITLNLTGEDYVGHAGGIETDGTNVWIAGEKKVFRFELADVLAAENKSAINIVDSFESPNGADFLCLNNGILWIGEFEKKGKYDTDETHHIDKNRAVSFGYRLNAGETCGIEQVPEVALSTRSLVQGMVITDEKIALSTSYSLPNSHIYIYQNPFANPTTETINVNDTDVPLYILTDELLENAMTFPSMSEEMTISNGRVFVLFENACKKYAAFTREQLRSVYSFEI